MQKDPPLPSKLMSAAPHLRGVGYPQNAQLPVALVQQEAHSPGVKLLNSHTGNCNRPPPYHCTAAGQSIKLVMAAVPP